MIGYRKSTLFLWFLAICSAALFLIAIHARLAERKALPFRAERMAFVERDGLTDLCLFTDARYTRNPAVADFSTPFQDHPASFEHFPSGSIIGPPKQVTRGMGR